jgi:ElaA protein
LELESKSSEHRWLERSFEQLNALELYRILAARAQVFVIEQQCFYEDADFSDAQCLHLFCLGKTSSSNSFCVDTSDNNEAQQLLAYARLVPPGLKFDEASIGRVLCTKPARGKGMARELMQRAIRSCHQAYGAGPIRIGAQHYLEAFYQSLGFQTISDVYDEDGIAHVDMLLSARPSAVLGVQP